LLNYEINIHKGLLLKNILVNASNFLGIVACLKGNPKTKLKSSHLKVGVILSISVQKSNMPQFNSLTLLYYSFIRRSLGNLVTDLLPHQHLRLKALIYFFTHIVIDSILDNSSLKPLFITIFSSLLLSNGSFLFNDSNWLKNRWISS
jgi:hypothetical protein